MWQEPRKAMEILHVRGDAEICFARQKKKIIKMMGVALLIAGIVFLGIYMNEEEGDTLAGDATLNRQGEGNVVVSVEQDGNRYSRTLALDMKERKYGKDEMKELSAKVHKELILQVVQKDNQVVMPKQLWGQVQLEWTYDDKYLKEEGFIRRTKIGEKGVDVVVNCQASSGNWKEDYQIPLHIVNDTWTPQNDLLNEACRNIRAAIREQETKEQIRLPTEYKGNPIRYENEKLPKDYSPVLIFCLIPILIPFLWKRKNQQKLKERENQLLLDYPGFVNKIMLLLSAGLTIRSAIDRIVGEYEKKGNPRYVYEELWVADSQIKNGQSETKALEEFGNRCGLLPYLRFGTLIGQNIRKGSAGLLDMLDADALDSFEQRKERIKQLGEEAGTKLLFPMMVMLILVMGLIMIPAFMGMS